MLFCPSAGDEWHLHSFTERKQAAGAQYAYVCLLDMPFSTISYSSYMCQRRNTRLNALANSNRSHLNGYNCQRNVLSLHWSSIFLLPWEKQSESGVHYHYRVRISNKSEWSIKMTPAGIKRASRTQPNPSSYQAAKHKNLPYGNDLGMNKTNQKHRDTLSDRAQYYSQCAHMFSMTCELIADWNPWLPPPYSVSALLCTPMELPGVLFEFGL